MSKLKFAINRAKLGDDFEKIMQYVGAIGGPLLQVAGGVVSAGAGKEDKDQLLIGQAIAASGSGLQQVGANIGAMQKQASVAANPLMPVYPGVDLRQQLQAQILAAQQSTQSKTKWLPWAIAGGAIVVGGTVLWAILG